MLCGPDPVQAANLIEDVGFVEGLSKLRVLHLRDNQIQKLDGFAQAGMDSLSYLNLRYTALSDYWTVNYSNS